MKRLLLSILLFAATSQAVMKVHFVPSATSSFSNTKSISLSSASTQYINFGNVSDMNFSGNSAVSFSIWYKPISNGAGYHPMVSRSDANHAYAVERNGNELYWDWYNSGARMRVKCAQTFSDGTWYHVIVSIDGSHTAAGMGITINGSAKTNTTLADSFSGSLSNAFDVWVGGATAAWEGGGGAYVDGELDEVSVWDKVLDSTDISNLKNGSGGPADLSSHPSVAHLLHWWGNGDSPDSGSTVNDRKASATGTTSGGPSFVSDVPTGVW